MHRRKFLTSTLAISALSIQTEADHMTNTPKPFTVKASNACCGVHNQNEIFSIFEGEYPFQIGNEKFTAKAGDTVFAPRGIPHTWIQLSEQGKQVYRGLKEFTNAFLEADTKSPERVFGVAET